MPSTDDLLAHLKSLPDRAARYAWLDGLERIERSGVLNRLGDQDRHRYRMHQENGVRSSRKAAAVADHAVEHRGRARYRNPLPTERAVGSNGARDLLAEWAVEASRTVARALGTDAALAASHCAAAARRV